MNSKAGHCSLNITKVLDVRANKIHMKFSWWIPVHYHMATFHTMEAVNTNNLLYRLNSHGLLVFELACRDLFL